MSLDLAAPAKKRLYGKKVTNAEMAKAIYALSKTMTQAEIAEKIGYKDRKSIRSFLAAADTMGMQQSQRATEEARIFSYYTSQDDFMRDPLIEKWVASMTGRKQGGKALKTWAHRLRCFRSVCNTTKTVPGQWITGVDREDILETGRKLLTAFMDDYMAGKADVVYRKGWDRAKISKTHVAYTYAQAIRDFLRVHGYNYPKNESSIMSQSIATFHGNYSSVRMTQEQYDAGKAYIKKKWGLDSDIFRWFGVGIEGMPRASAMRSMKSHFEEFKNSRGETILTVTAFESKTEHYKKGLWTKYIFSDDVQQSIRKVAKRSPYMIEHHRTGAAAEKKIYPKLREVYKYLGLDKIHLKDQDDEDTGYFMLHPSHALRHCGAQLMLRKTNWNITFVAKRGWKTAEELIGSYGEMPPEMELEVLNQI